MLTSFLFIPSSCRFISRNMLCKWWFMMKSCCLRKCIDLEWSCSPYYKGRMKEMRGIWLEINFSDCPNMHFLSFVRFYMKGYIKLFFSLVLVICIPQHATITMIRLCSILSSVQSSMAFTLAAFKMNWSIARCLLLRVMKKGWVGGKQGYLLLIYCLILFCVGRHTFI